VGSVCLGAGLALSLLIPIDKHLLSTSYLLVTFGASSLALAALTPLDPFLDGRMPPLGALGRNPLLASILGGILTLALHAWVPAGIPLWRHVGVEPVGPRPRDGCCAGARLEEDLDPALNNAQRFPNGA